MDAGPSQADVRETPAPAKINLALHVVGRRADGYHELNSLVVFAAEGDRLRMQQAERDRLTVSGLFGSTVPDGDSNIVLRALGFARDLLRESGRRLPSQEILLQKNLPPSSGMGGGSADAAALLRLVARDHPDLTHIMEDAAVRLGADVPMCLRSRNARVTGVGERIQPVTIGDGTFILLVNPGVEVSTPAIFSKLVRRDQPPLPPFPTGGFADHATLVAYLKTCRNDLAEPAETLRPVIAEAREAIRHLGASLVRMSGSGATVFGLFDRQENCESAARRLATDCPAWWVRPTTLRTEELR